MLVSIGELRGSLSCFAAEGNNLAEEAAIRRGDLRRCVLCALSDLSRCALRSICATSYHASYFPVGPPVVWCLCGSYVLLRVRSALHLVATCFKNYKNCEETKTSL